MNLLIRIYWLFIVAMICLPTSSTQAKSRLPPQKHDRDRVAMHGILLRKSDRFIVNSRPERLRLYRLKDGRLLREFGGEDIIPAIDVDPNEQFIAAGCSQGRTLVWDLNSGRKIWERKPQGETGAWDVSFAADGKSLVVADRSGRAFIYETSSGRIIRTIKLDDNHVRSAALSPDGSKGVLVDWERKLRFFDVRTGETRSTGIGAHSRIRYSMDGKYVFFTWRADLLRDRPELFILPANGPLETRSAGPFGITGIALGRLRPTVDGGLLVTGYRMDPLGWETVGWRYSPNTNKRETVWAVRATPSSGLSENTDFDPKRMIGVTLRGGLAYVHNLKTGDVLLEIDPLRSATTHPTTEKSRGADRPYPTTSRRSRSPSELRP